MNLVSNISSFWKLVLAILICESTGFASGLLAQVQGNAWFSALNKPSWNPPAYIFGPVWILLYLLMGISLWLIWKNRTSNYLKTQALFFFGVQLFFNFWWSILFFRFNSPAWAFVDIILMVFAIAITILKIANISRMASWLLVPYLLWVCFASVLNYSIWSLN